MAPDHPVLRSEACYQLGWFKFYLMNEVRKWNERTVDCKITQRSACGALHLSIVAAQQEKDGVECVSSHRSYFLLRDFCES